MATSYLIYAAYDNKYKSAAAACAANDWIFVGKLKYAFNEHPVRATERVVAELSANPAKYGHYLHEALIKSGSFHVQHLSTWTPANEKEAEVYPTDAESYWISQLQGSGGVIKNLAPKPVETK